MSSLTELQAAGCDKDWIGLGVQQPWAELILSGIKSVEVRSQPTKVRGPIYVYASKKISSLADAQTAIGRTDHHVEELPRGVVVGTIEIVQCRPAVACDADPSCVSAPLLEGNYAWQLQNPVRFDAPIRPRFLPYGVWFYPFRPRP